MTDKKKIPKKQKLRNAEYYDMQSVFDKLYADSKKGMSFTDLVEIIKRPENIKLAYRNMRKNKGSKTAGTDKKTISDLNKWKEEKLIAHVQRKLDWYIPQKVRRIEIPKDNGKTRPLSIYCYEDKLVQEALKRLLSAVFEPIFYNEMMGFRPNRSCHMALSMLNEEIGGNKTNWVLDADIRSFFDSIDHEWMMEFVGARIKDPRVLRLVWVMLKAGVVKDMGGYDPTEQGSGQGSVCSPILSCIYMHSVLLWWFHEVVKPTLKGYAGIVNYADDFVVCFQYRWEAERFYERLKHRMAHFGLSLAEEKCRLIEFGGFAENNRRHRGEGKPETFDFLGFTHICSRTGNGYFKVRRKTSRKKFIKKCKDIFRRIGQMRTMKTKEIIAKLNEILIGYYHYYGVYGNYPAVIAFRWHVLKSLFYWLNRRSQKKSYNWKGFLDMIKFGHPLARPKSFYVYI